MATSPDDVCMVCETTRDQHGDSNHKFSEDGQLIPIQPGPPARQKAPDEKRASLSPEAKGVADNMTSQTLLRLIDTLVEKEVISGKDLMYILGNHVPN